ncbi:MAG: hypothetical protein WB799_18280 [Candidatus Sulfotelmatobacter sp.]
MGVEEIAQTNFQKWLDSGASVDWFLDMVRESATLRPAGRYYCPITDGKIAEFAKTELAKAEAAVENKRDAARAAYEAVVAFRKSMLPEGVQEYLRILAHQEGRA